LLSGAVSSGGAHGLVGVKDARASSEIETTRVVRWFQVFIGSPGNAGGRHLDKLLALPLPSVMKSAFRFAMRRDDRHGRPRMAEDL
jgi:hypothetical protein